MTANSNTLKPASPTGRFQAGERRVGRKPGVPNIATRAIKELAGQYGPEAVSTLVQLMRTGDGDLRLRAAKELLDRAYGRPPQAIIGDREQPLEHKHTGIDELMQRLAAMAERVAA
jgi:hypothetical protein